MDSLEHGEVVTEQIPRFDDGMVNIQELLRVMAEALVNEIMNACKRLKRAIRRHSPAQRGSAASCT